MPYSDYKKCAKVLDKKRLLKQRVEALQIVNILEKLEKNPDAKVGFMHHPIVKMWKGHIDSLKLYCNTMILESISRKCNNTMKLYDLPKSNSKPESKIVHPWWISFSHLNYSHQASLLRKDPDHYHKYFYDLPDEYRECGYVWTNKLSKSELKSLKSKQDLKIEDIASPITKPKNPKIIWYSIDRGKYRIFIPNYPIDVILPR